MADPTKKGWVRTAQEARDQRSGVDVRAELAAQGIYLDPKVEADARRRTGPAEKFTADDVLAACPGTPPEEVAAILKELNQEPAPDALERFYEDDNESLVQGVLKSLDHRGADGLTEDERKSNAFHEALGAPPPFPPRPADKK